MPKERPPLAPEGYKYGSSDYPKTGQTDLSGPFIPIEAVPDPGPNPEEVLMQKEEEDEEESAEPSKPDIVDPSEHNTNKRLHDYEKEPIAQLKHDDGSLLMDERGAWPPKKIGMKKSVIKPHGGFTVYKRDFLPRIAKRGSQKPQYKDARRKTG